MSRRARRHRRGVVVVLAALPIYLESFWLQTGLFAMAAIIAAIGLTILVGIAGQLSLGARVLRRHRRLRLRFLAGKEVPGVDGPAGLGLPPLLALIGAVLLAGLAGALFSPIAGRVRGIYLGLASLGLVFLGQHVLQNATGITGGYRGVAVPPFSLFGFSFSNTSPDDAGDPRRAVRDAGAALVRRAGARRRRAVVRAQPGRAAGRGARWRRSATARSRPPPTASTSSATRRPRSRCPRCTRGSGAC